MGKKKVLSLKILPCLAAWVSNIPRYFYFAFHHYPCATAGGQIVPEGTCRVVIVYEMPKKVVNIVANTSPAIQRCRTAMPPDKGMSDMAGAPRLVLRVRLDYCFTPYQRLWLYNGAPLVAFYDTLGIRRTYSRLKLPASSRGGGGGRLVLRDITKLNYVVSDDNWQHTMV